MKVVKYLSVLILFLAVQSCTGSRVVDVKSPCVSGRGGPCDDRKPINTWLDKESA